MSYSKVKLHDDTSNCLGGLIFFCCPLNVFLKVLEFKDIRIKILPYKEFMSSCMPYLFLLHLFRNDLNCME